MVQEFFSFESRNTPLQLADRFGTAIGLEPGSFWIKRDDLTGLVGGGNKARKLELLVGDALANGAKTLVTGGAAQSNHVRATAAAARAAGLSCVAVLAQNEIPTGSEGNLVLDDLLATEVVWTTPDNRYRDFDATVQRLRSEGRLPYAIPLGGSSPLGSSAYATCAREITDTLGDEVVVVCAVGSGGTFAGLVAGLTPSAQVVGFDVAAVPTIAKEVAALVPETAELLGTSKTAEWDLDPRQNHLPYGEPSDEVFSAIRLLAETEGLVLDPVYTGRAMAGLLDRIRSGWDPAGRPLVFVHSGGLPALFTQRYAHQYRSPSQLAGGRG